ncbi:MAG: hypothetical protein HXK61_04245 [Atopobiaceae bacterium]|nr:hypothetical protein [Atopobiaceae bacterium]
MSKKLFSRRAFAGLSATTTIGFLTGCNDTFMQVFNGQDPNNNNGDKKTENQDKNLSPDDISADWNSTPLTEQPDNPTLDGDINKIIVGVWEVDSAVGAGDKAGNTYDHMGILNQAYKDGTVPHYIFKNDGTHELHHFDGKVDHGKWSVKEDSTISCSYEDGTVDELTYDKDKQRLNAPAKTSISYYQKLSDNPEDTSQIPYIDGKVVNFAATLPGVWEVIYVDKADPNEPDFDLEGIKKNIKESNSSYFFSVHKNAFCALYYPSGRVLPAKIFIKDVSEDGLSYPILVASSDQFENVEEGTLVRENNPRTLRIKLKAVEYLFQHNNHREDDFGDLSYAPTAPFPWNLDHVNKDSESNSDSSSSSKGDSSKK